jgi:adhesin transport system outer membrane protein
MRFDKTLLSLMSLTALNLYAIDLSTSMAEVLKTNPDVIEQKKNYNAAYEDVNIAKGDWFLPSVDLSANIGKSISRNHETDSTTRGTNAGIGITATENLFDGFGTTNNIKVKEAALAAAAYGYLQAANESALSTAQAYIEVVRARDILGVEQDSVMQHEKIQTDIRKRSAGGVGVISDLQEIEAKTNLAYSNHLTQNENLKSTQINFHRQLGRYVAPQNLADPSIRVSLPATIEEATEFAMKNNPAILVQKFNLDQARYTYERDKKEYYPTVDFVLGHSYRDNENDNTGTRAHSSTTSGEIQLNWNLFRGFKDDHTAQRNISLVHSAHERRNVVIRDIIQELQLAWTANRMLEKEFIYLSKFENQSSMKLETYKKEFWVGKKSLLDLLSAESDYNGAKQRIINTKLDMILAKFRILKAMGILADSVGAGIKEDVGIIGLVKVDYGFRINEVDRLPLDYNHDGDGLDINDDICDNSRTSTNRYGCAYRLGFDDVESTFGTTALAATPVVRKAVKGAKKGNSAIDDSIEGWDDGAKPTKTFKRKSTKKKSYTSSRSKCSNYVAPLDSNKQYYTFKILGDTPVSSKVNGSIVDRFKPGTKVTGYYDANGWARVSGIIDDGGWRKYCKTGYIRTNNLKAIYKKGTAVAAAAPLKKWTPKKKSESSEKCLPSKKAHYYNKKYDTSNMKNSKVEDFKASS